MSLRSSLSRLALALLVAGLVAAPGASAAPFESQGTVTQDARGEAAADPLDLPAYPAPPARAVPAGAGLAARRAGACGRGRGRRRRRARAAARRRRGARARRRAGRGGAQGARRAALVALATGGPEHRGVALRAAPLLRSGAVCKRLTASRNRVASGRAHAPPMPDLRSHPSHPERRRRPSGRRTIVRAVVTELSVALEPACRDPFLDGCGEGPRFRPSPTPALRSPRRLAASGR